MKMSSHSQKSIEQHQKWKRNTSQNQENDKTSCEQAQHLKSKDRCYLIYFLNCFLVELILHAMAKGRPLSCESQGVLRVAAANLHL